MENHQPSNGRKAMEEELIKGRDIANQLLEIIGHKSTTHRGGVEEVELGLVLPFAEDLVRKVMRSFTNTLLLLKTDIVVSNDIVMPITTKDMSVCPIKPEDKDEVACKGFFKVKRRRGSYKRKSTAPTWEKNSSILMEDGYVWRKYGQKMTMNSKYLRSYYRCTHKYDEGCPAIKQVQRVQEDPPLYRTTYYGHHNCKSSLISPEIMLEPPSNTCSSSMFLNFSNTTYPRKEEYSVSSSISSSTKKEPMEVIPDDHIVHSELPSSDCHMLCEYEPNFNCLRHDSMVSSIESVQFDKFYGSGFNCLRHDSMVSSIESVQFDKFYGSGLYFDI